MCSQTTHHLDAQVVPESLLSIYGDLVIVEASLEVVEDGKLITCHDVGVGLGLDLDPDVGDGLVENFADGRVAGTLGALASDLKSLIDRRHALLGSLSRGGRGNRDAVRHGEAGRRGSRREAVTETSRRSRQEGSRRVRSGMQAVLRLRGSNGEHDVWGRGLEGGRGAHVNMGCPGSAL